MATHSSVLAWRIPGRGAWWAAVCGVAQSRTRLKRLSSSSSSSGSLCHISTRISHTHTHIYMLSHFSPVQLFVTPWTAAHQVPLSMGFPRQEHWCGWPCLPPGDLPDSGIQLCLIMFPALAGDSLPLAPPGKPIYIYIPSLLSFPPHSPCTRSYFLKLGLFAVWRLG